MGHIHLFISPSTLIYHGQKSDAFPVKLEKPTSFEHQDNHTRPPSLPSVGAIMLRP
jgi:hypothetical protein